MLWQHARSASRAAIADGGFWLLLIGFTIGTSTIGAIACVTTLGLGFGVATIARPALLADRYGTPSYATISGGMNLPINTAEASAPLAGAAIASSAAGYGILMYATAGACARLTGSVAAV